MISGHVIARLPGWLLRRPQTKIGRTIIRGTIVSVKGLMGR